MAFNENIIGKILDAHRTAFCLSLNLLLTHRTQSIGESDRAIPSILPRVPRTLCTVVGSPCAQGAGDI